MSEDPIRLGQFLKFTGLADTGGQARDWIQSGFVFVDGVLETRRGRQLADGMAVEVRLPHEMPRTATVGAEVDPFA